MESISIKLPKRISGLESLAYNLWWSWKPEAREIFKVLDRRLWNYTQHNPVKMLVEIPVDRLENVARDSEFLAKYDAVVTDFNRAMTTSNNWCHENCPELGSANVAYFSMEFAVHS